MLFKKHNSPIDDGYLSRQDIVNKIGKEHTKLTTNTFLLLYADNAVPASKTRWLNEITDSLCRIQILSVSPKDVAPDCDFYYNSMFGTYTNVPLTLINHIVRASESEIIKNKLNVVYQSKKEVFGLLQSIFRKFSYLLSIEDEINNEKVQNIFSKFEVKSSN